ncbi:hypothetical protein BH11ARM2_BH11ARM2_06100 [soil metagenome]
MKTQKSPEGVDRRDFLRLTVLATAGVATGGLPALAGARLPRRVPVEKGAVPDLYEKGERLFYRGDDLRFIGMPVGGICAGQVYLGGDGRLWLWDVFNEIKFGTVPRTVAYKGQELSAGSGANYVDPPHQVHPFAQGFAVRVNGQTRPLDGKGWKDVAFCGEYPMGYVEYRDPDSPLSVDLEAFSPFVPLDELASSYPAVVMRFTLKNTGTATVKAEIGGWMENPTGLHAEKRNAAVRRNRTVDGRAEFSVEEPPFEEHHNRPPIVFEEWAAEGFGRWKVSGDAFGAGAYDRDKVSTMGAIAGGPGRKLVKSYRMEPGAAVTGDALTGKLVGPEFTIERDFIEFWIGGGNHPETAYIGLFIDGKLVRSATGRQEDNLHLDRFDVAEFAGKTAHLEIVDDEKGFWGQIGIGQIAFVDAPTLTLKEEPDFGDMALGLLDAAGRVVHDLGDKPLETLFGASRAAEVSAPAPARPVSGVVTGVELAPGQSATVSFAIAWRFPNLILLKLGRTGHHYAGRFPSAGAALADLRKNYPSLYGTTKEWHATWYDSTLPRWFLDRTMANASTLATMTCVRFANSRFYAWEGIGCCDGTCGHVWQYAHSVGRLFPALERSIREMADYMPGVGFEAGGLIDFRAEYDTGYAADAQAGYILRTLREHQTSSDDAFLKRVYPRMREALEYLVRQDTDDDGILEGSQHNTLDVNLYGPSSWLTSLYLAALKAGEEMAVEMGDAASAKRWRAIFERGSSRFDEVFWNGDYYIHRLNEAEHLEGMRIGNGCEIDQLMGQSWAHQIGLGRIVKPEKARAALKALYRNNFLPDVGPFREKEKAGRWYAVPGEAGLLVCTFPHGDRKEILGPEPTWASMYFNEVWTGTEYQAASHMMAEGLVEEGMRVVKATHDRHHPSKRNPWNEVECSDHYARGMASHGVFVTVCGFEFHGPKGHLGFAPKVNPEDFRAAFTAAEGWGTFWQKKKSQRLGFEAGIRLRHGALRLKTLGVDFLLEKNLVVTLNGERVAAGAVKEPQRSLVTFAAELRLKAGDELVVRMDW